MEIAPINKNHHASIHGELVEMMDFHVLEGEIKYNAYLIVLDSDERVGRYFEYLHAG